MSYSHFFSLQFYKLTSDSPTEIKESNYTATPFEKESWVLMYNIKSATDESPVFSPVSSWPCLPHLCKASLTRLGNEMQ